MLQACARAVDFKVGHHLARDTSVWQLLVLRFGRRSGSQLLRRADRWYNSSRGNARHEVIRSMLQSPPTRVGLASSHSAACRDCVFALHLIGNPHYGFFRDELYFIICGRHLEWGLCRPATHRAPFRGRFADVWSFPCASARGASLFRGRRSVRQLFARRGTWCDDLRPDHHRPSCILYAVLMDFGMKVSPDMVGLWLWPLLALYTLRLTKGADPRWWLAVGAITGICLQSKYSVLSLLQRCWPVCCLHLSAGSCSRTGSSRVSPRRAHRIAEFFVASTSRIPDGGAASQRSSR